MLHFAINVHFHHNNMFIMFVWKDLVVPWLKFCMAYMNFTYMVIAYEPVKNVQLFEKLVAFKTFKKV